MLIIKGSCFLFSHLPTSHTRLIRDLHPDLAPYYDLSVFLPISAEKQRERILKRNAPAHAKQFFDRWIPFEQRYFDALDVRNRCDLILSADD